MSREAGRPHQGQEAWWGWPWLIRGMHASWPRSWFFPLPSSETINKLYLGWKNQILPNKIQSNQVGMPFSNRPCYSLVSVHAKSISRVWLCDPTNHDPPGSSAHGILQARTQECVAISSTRGSSQTRDQTCISCVSCIGKRVLYHWCHLGSPEFSWSLRQKSRQDTPSEVSLNL